MEKRDILIAHKHEYRVNIMIYKLSSYSSPCKSPKCRDFACKIVQECGRSPLCILYCTPAKTSGCARMLKCPSCVQRCRFDNTLKPTEKEIFIIVKLLLSQTERCSIIYHFLLLNFEGKTTFTEITESAFPLFSHIVQCFDIESQIYERLSRC